MKLIFIFIAYTIICLILTYYFHLFASQNLYTKSEIKYMEAGLVKVPTIASSTDSYNYAIHSGTNGILIYQEDEWFTALSSLIVNKEARQQNVGGEIICYIS